MSAGTFAFARIFDLTGGYTPALYLGIGANLAAAVAILVSGRLDSARTATLGAARSLEVGAG